MPPASSETKEALDDFDRFARRGAWERATKALDAIPEAQATRFVDGQNGFIVSVAQKRRSVLAGLSPEGQAAYRLFYDSDAKKLLDQAEGAAEQATLERLYSSYFLTSVGDNAADRLGDMYFEQGQFDRAADCWMAILRERPDSELSPALMTVKAALRWRVPGDVRSSRRSGRRRPTASATRSSRSGAGRRRRPSTSGASRAASARRKGSAPAASDGPPPNLAESIPAAWQLRFGASVTAGMTPVELAQWEATSFSGAVPSVAVEGQTLFAQLPRAMCSPSTWRAARCSGARRSFHNLERPPMQGQCQMIDTKRFAILASPGFVWSLGSDVKDPN